MTSSADREWIFFPGDWRRCHSRDFPFVCGSKRWAQVSSAVIIRDKVQVSRLASKSTSISEEIIFTSVLCLNVWSGEPISRKPSNTQDIEWCDNISLCWLKNEHQSSGCDALILANNGISMLQHLRIKVYDRTARASSAFPVFFSPSDQRSFWRP